MSGAPLIQSSAAHDDGVYIEGREGHDGHGHIKSFVRRAGRMSDAQHRYFDDMMPKIGIAYRPENIDLNAVFGRDNPKILEIGCGMGETTAKIAEANPDSDYFGLEVHVPGVGALCKLIAEKNLSNLRIGNHDAVEVVRDMLPEGSLSGIHVFFPDPWHKTRHKKRRLIQPHFVELLASRLKPGGYFHCATDWENYALQMLDVLGRETSLQNSVANPTAEALAAALEADSSAGLAGFAPRPEYRPLTKFENRGLRLGHGVWDVIFEKK
ncbi:tRNA (guanosine(46)-N7)-methyltransferase TrmB [Dechloromonas sp. XY25]|uniref:tRNA (guanine-N(7)-)-methyltransferase n=1 Tax=Dechloromonas hankyongensis TaxID=2908002 RepID=A0ABS9JX32_9RHOO|nr:tRNA (guanosine(46)-N7)-methyltransferase TrmB [Dechloromonas hankyongensis]MCG2575475.1 tRNA (guanosine(46)-N7)-methyltransferase TrmB [Dechloromonas hankyongensis]